MVEELAQREVLSHNLIWVADPALEPNFFSTPDNWRDMGDGKPYAPANGDALTFDPTKTAGGKQGTVSDAIDDVGNLLAGLSLTALTTAKGYTGKVSLNFDLGVSNGAGVTLAGGTLSTSTTAGAGLFTVGAVGQAPPGQNYSNSWSATTLTGSGGFLVADGARWC